MNVEVNANSKMRRVCAVAQVMIASCDTVLATLILLWIAVRISQARRFLTFSWHILHGVNVKMKNVQVEKKQIAFRNDDLPKIKLLAHEMYLPLDARYDKSQIL